MDIRQLEYFLAIVDHGGQPGGVDPVSLEAVALPGRSGAGAGIVDTALLGGPVPDPAAIRIRIRSQEAANDLLALAQAGRL